MLLSTAGDIQWGDLGTWASAAATLLAVIVALFLGLLPSRQERERRPVLGVEVGEVEPFERPVFEAGRVSQYRLRLAVTNVGQSTAVGVAVTIERWWSWAGGPKKWSENPIDPVMAGWVGQGVDGTGEVVTVDIPPGGRAFCDVLKWDPNRARLSLALDVRRSVVFPLEGGPYGEQRVALSVSCGNGEGKHVVLSGTLREGQPVVDSNNIVRRSPIYNVVLTDAPDPIDVVHEGLLGLWTERHRESETHRDAD